jgi:acyl-CoA thioester hydrolase
VAEGAPHRHSIRVRYGECDMQGVVFNAHYLAYFDDAMDHLLRSANWEESSGWEIMLKRTEVTWDGAVTVDEILDIDVAVERWGRSSFDVSFSGSVAAEARVQGLTTYVVISGDPPAPTPIPDGLRAILK